MKLPIAGQATAVEPFVFQPEYDLSGAILVVPAAPDVSIWPLVEGAGAIVRLRSGPVLRREEVLRPIRHEVVEGPTSEVASLVADHRGVVVGRWAATWARPACRVLFAPAGRDLGELKGVPWDLVLHDARPTVLRALLSRA